MAKALVTGLSLLPRIGVRIEVTDVNGQPGAMAFDADDRLVAVMGLDIVEGRIQTIHAVINPDKLRNLGEVGDLAALQRAARKRNR